MNMRYIISKLAGIFILKILLSKNGMKVIMKAIAATAWTRVRFDVRA